MTSNKKIAFLDIEANQTFHKIPNYILEVGVVSDSFEYHEKAQHSYDIKPKIKYLLNIKDDKYYLNLKKLKKKSI